MDNPSVATQQHYENFPVASRLCPAHLRPAVMALYAFARTADDLADEGEADAAQRLQALRPYRDGELWLGHHQFMQQFVHPLLLNALAGVSYNNWYKGNLDGIRRVDLVRSPVAIAVHAGALRPEVSTEAALKQAVLDAPSIGYSTGPSGDHLARLFARWGLADTLKARSVTPPPGVPVGRLVAEGAVALGFQQLSELIHLDGIQVLGTLPPGADFITTFSAGLCAGSSQATAVQALLRFLTAPASAAVKRRHGMEPA